MKNVHKTYNQTLSARLTKELAELRKGAGLTPVKLQSKLAIRAHISRLTNLPIASLTGSQVYAFLVTEISNINTTRTSQALSNALGLGHEGPHSLSDRRTKLATQLSKHPDTIERYENQGLVELVAHLVDLQPTDSLSIPHSTNTAYLQHLEEQVAKARDATILGLSGLLSLERRTEELVTYLESSPRPYLDTNVEITFLPSERGNNWYRMVVEYAFQGHRDTFRAAVVTTNEDGERLMKLGLIDEFHKLNDEIDPTREVRAFVNSTTFTLRNPHTNKQKLLRLKSLTPEHAKRLLQSVGEPLIGPCRLLETTVPTQWQTADTIYEYRNAINLRDDIHYAYWYAPSLMYVKKLTFDYSKFPNREKWQFMALPFLGHQAGETLDRNMYSFVLHPNSWIMPGHGIGLTWE